MLKGRWLAFDEKAHTWLVREKFSHVLTKRLPKNWLVPIRKRQIVPDKGANPFLFTDGRSWSEARPHKGFRRRRSRATSRRQTLGERRIGPKYAICGWTLAIVL